MENKELRQQLMMKKKNGYDVLSAEEIAAVDAYAEEYKAFLGECKTERECVAFAVEKAEAAGFVQWDLQQPVKPGDKVYYVNRNKSVYLAVVGARSAAEGFNIATGHPDSPHMELKPTPLYEDSEIAFFKTHDYASILQKYQWVSRPLALHGVIVRKDGTSVSVKIGEDPTDPVFMAPDLNPHAGKDRATKPLYPGVPHEKVNLFAGGRPYPEDDGKDRVKLNVLAILYEKYGITEEDFISAELEVVPADNPRDVGFDRTFIGGYGHDNRSGTYACLKAILETEAPNRTCVSLLIDKEEVSSEGVTSAQSQDIDRFLGALCRQDGVELFDCYEKSLCLTVDTKGVYDPNFSEYNNKRESARFHYGAAFAKFTGAMGKSGASDATAELMRCVTDIMDKNGVLWQMSHGSKIGSGYGGGTVTKFFARRNMNAVDFGTPTTGAHTPYEICSKIDVYMTYKGVTAVYGE